MPDDVREIKSRLDIADVIGDYVPLKKKGNSLWGLCPFHTEKTPSFSVSRERQTFHCFGCGKGGDIFSFVMELDGLAFPEALELLASRAGVTLSERTKSPVRRSSVDGRVILEEALSFFRSSLMGESGSAVRAYLLRRGIPKESWSRFELGWGAASWDALMKHLLSSGYRKEELLSSGLVVAGERGAYDRFRSRLIFSVRDEMGRLAGFGGRVIDGDGVKYVNSPEGDLFNKRRLLYFLHSAKKNIRDRGRIILTEGYMDAIRAHLAGFTETVASLGTALTEEHASLIKRFSDLCYIAYDADGAGQGAAVRGMYLLQKRGVDVRVVRLPDGKDPDDLLGAEDGIALFEQRLKKALPLPLYHTYAVRDALRTPGMQHKAREELFAGLASLPRLDVVEYIPAIARELRIFEHELSSEIELRCSTARTQEKSREGLSHDAQPSDESALQFIPDKELDLECAFCSLLWQNERIIMDFTETDLLSLFSDEATSGIIAAIISGCSPEELEERWRALGERSCPERIARGNALLARGELDAEHAGKLLNELRMNFLRRRYNFLKPLIISGEASDEERAEYFEYAKKIKTGL